MLWKVSVFKRPKPEKFYFPIKKMNFCEINERRIFYDFLIAFKLPATLAYNSCKSSLDV